MFKKNERPVIPDTRCDSYFVEQIHISVWDRKSSTPILSFRFQGEVFTSSASFVLFLLGRAKEKR
jgi:hypothetical protein